MALQNLQKAVDMEADLRKLKDTVADLQREVGRLRDIEAIRNLQHAFVYYLAAGCVEDAFGLFTQREDREVDIQAEVYVGHDDISKFLTLHRRGVGQGYPFKVGFVKFGKEHGEIVARLEGLGGEGSEFVKEEGEWKIWKTRWNVGRALNLRTERAIPWETSWPEDETGSCGVEGHARQDEPDVQALSIQPTPLSTTVTSR